MSESWSVNELLAGQSLSEEELESLLEAYEVGPSDREVIGTNAFTLN